MAYLYARNNNPAEGFGQIEIQMDTGATAILEIGKWYVLSATEVARARKYVVMTQGVAPTLSTPIGIYRLPVRGNPAQGDAPLWDSASSTFIPGPPSAGSGGSTDQEVVRDTIASALVAGANVAITPNDAANTITISATGTTDVEVVRDTIASALVAGTNVTITSNDATDTITINASGAVPTPYDSPGAPTSFGKAPLPSDRTIDPNSASIIAAVVAQANHDGTALAAGANAPPTFAIDNFGGVTRTLDPNARAPSLKRVKVLSSWLLMRAIGDAGIPIPDDMEIQVDSDGSAFLYQPQILHGPGYKGRAWEFTGGFRYATGTEVTVEGYQYVTTTLARISNADNYDGVMRDIYPAGFTAEQPWTDPWARTSTAQAQGYGQETGVAQYGWMGAFAVGATPPGQGLLPTPKDLFRGYALQPVRFMCSNCAPSTVGPARRDRGDGTLASTYPMVEGTLFTLPQTMVMPTGMTPGEQFLFRTAQVAGLMLTDKTSVCLAVSLASSCSPYFVSNSPIDGRDWSSHTLANFPWSSLRAMIPGSAGTPHPRTANKVTTGLGALATFEVWLEPQRDGLINDASVATLRDYSGNGRDATTPPERAAPVYKTAVKNGQAAVRFAGSSGMSFPALLLGDFTCFVVHQTTGDAIMIAAESGYGQMARQGDPYTTGADRYLVANDNPSYADISSTATATARTNWSILEVWRSGSTVSWAENGTSRGTGTLANPIRAGALFWVPVAPTAQSVGDVGFVGIVASALSSGVRSSIRAALGTQFAITVV